MRARDKRWRACIGSVAVGLLLAVTALTVLPVGACALDDARRRVIDEACPAYQREDKGSNGVMSPREVRCRLAMGETYAEIDADIRTLQQTQATEERRSEEGRREARSRAADAREAARRAAPRLCQAMIEEHRAGHWFTSSSTAVALLRDDPEGRRVDAKAIAEVARVMDLIGHNYSEPDQRALVLGARTNDAFQRWVLFNDRLDGIGADLRARARRAQSYEETGRTAAGPVQASPNATAYAFACFLEQRFGSIQADPFDRAEKRDPDGRYIGTR